MAIAVFDRQPEGLRSLSGCIPVDAATAASRLSTAPIASRHAHPRWRKRMVIRLPEGWNCGKEEQEREVERGLAGIADRADHELQGVICTLTLPV